ncbi:winged helix-turn-helix domain-containing protein [Pyrodictium abyssi]|uniref:HTH arsR-type domain-containing protein n=1 Tax=Pyrodictium abyssi TaxID=54256 RepID=A0ABM8IZK7_9CREN|nr:hypothetical protein PABY_17430 [Pyrodictium abyssi]
MRGRGAQSPPGGCRELDRKRLRELLLEPTRLLIVAVLAEGCRRFIELYRLLGVSKGSLHFHLRVLEENCVVTRSYRLSSSDRPALMVCLSSDARRVLVEALEEVIMELAGIREKLLEKETE